MSQPSQEDEKSLKAEDIKKSVGLSYRQINDWDSKGILPTERNEKAKWRRYSSREVFVIMVCKALRDSFGVPLSSLGFVRSFMQQEGADHLEYVVSMMGIGFSVYLLTDLKKTFVIDTDYEFAHLLDIGFFRSEEPDHFIFLNLNPLVNRMLSIKGMGPLKINENLYDGLRAANHMDLNQNAKERDLLRLIREGEYKRIVAHLNNGQIVQIDTEEELLGNTKHEQEQAIVDLLKEKKFQSITVQIANGKIVRLTRKSPIKYEKATEKS